MERQVAAVTAEARQGGARWIAWSAVLAATLAPLAAAAPRQGNRQSAVAVTITTNDHMRLLQADGVVRWRRMRPGSRTVWIDDRLRYQTVAGFGAAFTDSAAYLLNQVARPRARRLALRELFTRHHGGIGLSFMVVPIGASDIARSGYNYDEPPSHRPDPLLKHFSIAHDRRNVIPLIRAARRLNPQLRLLAVPWSPPGWMKTSGSMIGGTLLPQYQRVFAAYLVKFLLAYRRAGIPVQFLSLQNEPCYVPRNYPGMYMSAGLQRRLLRRDVLPAVAAAGLHTRVLIYDHNWDHPDYPNKVLAAAAIAKSPQVAGIAWHGYGGTPGVQSLLAARYPRLGQYETEHSGGTWVHDQVRQDFAEIIEVLRNQGKAYLKWSLALDRRHGPHDGGCATCTPLVVVDTHTGAVSRTVQYATLGQFSRFILPSARRVYSSDTAGVESVAFINPGGGHVLVVYDDTPTRNTFQVEWGARGFLYTLPAYSGATFTWTGSVSGTSVLDATAYQSAGSLAASGGRDRGADLYSWGVVTRENAGPGGGYMIERAVSGDWALFPPLNFGVGVDRVTARVACGRRACGTIEFRLGSLYGKVIARLPVKNTGGWQHFVRVAGPAVHVRGVHDLYIQWCGGNSVRRLASVQSYRFH
jgi:glucosylceramidase